MKRGFDLINKITPVRLFYGALAILIALTVIQLPVQDGKAFFSLLHSDKNDIFMDFFNSIYDAGFEDPYAERGVIYPPLAYLFYRLCGYLFPQGADAFSMRNSQTGIVTACAVTVFSVFILYKIFLPEKADNKERRKVLAVLLATVPFWYTFERGNIILPTLVFLAYFVQNYKSESRIRRELALISLAIAAALKIYPAIFGIILITEKRFKDALRCILYGIILFFVPFLFFGGFSSLVTMLGNITSTGVDMFSRGTGYKVNIDNTLRFISEALHVNPVGADAVKVIFALITAFIFFFSKKAWQKYMALCSVMIIFPAFSYTYTLIFIAIPFFAFVFDKPKTNTRNLTFSLLFLCMLAPFPLDGEKLFDSAPHSVYLLNLTTVISSIAILTMLVAILFDMIYTAKRPHTQNKTFSLKGGAVSMAYIKFAILVAIIVFLFIAGYLYCDRLYNTAASL